MGLASFMLNSVEGCYNDKWQLAFSDLLLFCIGNSSLLQDF
jgi:hypothetical protein